jgi:hypothetical protein
MYRLREPAPRPLSESNWAENEDFLYGVDLFNASYFWEAHVYWERLWALPSTEPGLRSFLQALIQTAAACLKARQGRAAGATRLLDRARLEAFGAGKLGIDAGALASGARRFVNGEESLPPSIGLEKPR